MNNKTFYYSVLVFALIASLIFGVFMTLSISQSAETTITNINAYSADKVKYFNLISIVFAICLIVFLLFTFFQKKKLGKSLKLSSAASKYAYIFGGVISSAVVLFSLISEIVSEPYIEGVTSSNGADGFYRFVKYTALGKDYNFAFLGLVLVFAVAAVYFFYGAFKSHKQNMVLAYLSIAPIVAFGAKLIFDFLMQNSNGFGKLYNFHLLSLGFILLFFVNETRFYIKKSAPALYVFFGLCASVATSIYSIPIIILSLAGVISVSGTNLMFAVMDIVFVAYVYVRLFNLAKKNKYSSEPYIADASELTDINIEKI